jgi:hypothetical protein
VLKKVVVGTSSLSKSSITFETSIKSPSTIDRNMPTPINNRTKQAFLTPLQPSSTNTNKKRELSPEGKQQHVASDHSIIEFSQLRSIQK